MSVPISNAPTSPLAKLTFALKLMLLFEFPKSTIWFQLLWTYSFASDGKIFISVPLSSCSSNLELLLTSRGEAGRICDITVSSFDSACFWGFTIVEEPVLLIAELSVETVATFCGMFSLQLGSTLSFKTCDVYVFLSVWCSTGAFVSFGLFWFFNFFFGKFESACFWGFVFVEEAVLLTADLSVEIVGAFSGMSSSQLDMTSSRIILFLPKSLMKSFKPLSTTSISQTA